MAFSNLSAPVIVRYSALNYVVFDADFDIEANTELFCTRNVLDHYLPSQIWDTELSFGKLF